jgi:hypothetical protein
LQGRLPVTPVFGPAIDQYAIHIHHECIDRQGAPLAVAGWYTAGRVRGQLERLVRRLCCAKIQCHGCSRCVDENLACGSEPDRRHVRVWFR